MLGCEATATGSDSTPPGSGGETSTSTGAAAGTTFDDALTCAGSPECDGGYCVAPYDAGAGASIPAMGMGAPVCVDACVPELALDRWCLDDAACCDGLRCTATDGLCTLASTDADSSVGESWATLGDTTESGGSSDTTTDGTSGGAESSGTGSSESSGTGGTSASTTG